MYNPLNYESKRPSTAVATAAPDPSEVHACGGIGRLKYLLLQIFLIAAIGLGGLVLNRMPFNDAQRIGWIFLIGWMICAGWVTVQRYKNLGYPWYYFFMFLIPIANLYYGVLLSIGPEGYAIHKTGDKWSKIAVVFILIMFILGVFVQILITGLERRPL